MIQVDFGILCISSQLIVKQNYIIYFHTQGSFSTAFCISFWKKVHNLKEIVNYTRIVCFDRWLRRYDHISTNKVLLYYWRVYFVYRLFILLITTFSFLLFLYTVSWRYKIDYLHASIDILFYIMFYIINTMKKYQVLLYHVRTQDTKMVPT